MIKKFLKTVFVLFLFYFVAVDILFISVNAKEVKIETAKQVAINILNEKRSSEKRNTELMRQKSEILNVFKESANGVVLYYVINVNPEGWALIAADDASTPVIAFSEKGIFSLENQPPALKMWMDEIKFKLSKAIEQGVEPNEKVLNQWEKMSLPTEIFYLENCMLDEAQAKKGETFQTEDVGQMIWTIWGQGFLYNIYCPCTSRDIFGTCWANAKTGCVATAMAQIIKYWSWPSHGWGSHCYTPSGFDEQCVDFSTASYNYSAMPLIGAGWLSTNVGKLIYHCGVSVDMMYGADSSGAYSSDVDDALSKYFGYQAATYQAKETTKWVNGAWQTTVISDADWLIILKNELKAGRPIFYAGTDQNGEGGHAFVCDGYSGDTLHMNWGWDGLFNGYYTLDLDIKLLWFIPIDEFSTNHRIVKNIRPNQAPVANAGPDITVTKANQNSIIIKGIISDPDKTTIPLTYRWTHGNDVLKDWSTTTNGKAWLYLSTVSNFDFGSYTLKLEVSDKIYGRSDTMVLTIENAAPTANAGPNRVIKSKDQNTLILNGYISDSDTPVNNLKFRWIEGGTVLKNWAYASSNNVTLDCGLLSPFSLGIHTITLEVFDGISTASDHMYLTVENSAPNVGPTGAGIFEIWSMVTLGGSVSDFDGDTLTVRWLEGSNVLDTQTVSTIFGGTPVNINDYQCDTFPLGLHILTLEASDGINVTSMDIQVEVVDTTVPTLAPVPDKTIIWPPNHKMVPITIEVNADDNSGGLLTIEAFVSSNEPLNDTGDGETIPDWTEPEIDQEAGIIYLDLRAERAGDGDGRVYTILIRVTDESGNFSEVSVNIVVPHDKVKGKPIKIKHKK